MAWLILITGGLLEVVWAVSLKYTDGFTRLVPTILTAGAVVASLVLLGFAARTLPIGTAYAVWVGIGAAGAAVVGMILFSEPATPARLFFITLLVVAVVGLRITTPSEPTDSRSAQVAE